MDIFANKKELQDWSELTKILKESHQYFQNVPMSERGNDNCQHMKV